MLTLHEHLGGGFGVKTSTLGLTAVLGRIVCGAAMTTSSGNQLSKYLEKS